MIMQVDIATKTWTGILASIIAQVWLSSNGISYSKRRLRSKHSSPNYTSPTNTGFNAAHLAHPGCGRALISGPPEGCRTSTLCSVVVTTCISLPSGPACLHLSLLFLRDLPIGVVPGMFQSSGAGSGIDFCNLCDACMGRAAFSGEPKNVRSGGLFETTVAGWTPMCGALV